jgi:aarF domain-containing kinase
VIQKEEKNYFLLPLDHFLYKIKNIYEANKDEYCLPRSYDREVIRNYWIRRPLSVVSRFGKIGYELSPTVASYIYHKQQQQQNNGGVNNNDSASSASLSASSLEEKIKEEEELKTQQRQQQQAIQLREALTNLGPAFVKAGQQIAIRPDLIPPSMLKELQKLCDSVRPIPDEVAMEVLRNELRMKNQQQIDDIFEDLHLVASASLGQVYKARIRKTNELVAIKVQRPGMEKAFSLDLFLLQMWGDFMDAFTSVFTKQVPFHSKFFDAFSQGSYFELDYENEAQNQIYFQRELANRHSKVKVPDVYEEYSTRRVLTSEWIEGVKLADSSNETIRELIPIGVNYS